MVRPCGSHSVKVIYHTIKYKCAWLMWTQRHTIFTGYWSYQMCLYVYTRVHKSLSLPCLPNYITWKWPRKDWTPCFLVQKHSSHFGCCGSAWFHTEISPRKSAFMGPWFCVVPQRMRFGVSSSTAPPQCVFCSLWSCAGHMTQVGAWAESCKSRFEDLRSWRVWN